MAKKTQSVGLLRHLTFAGENRADGALTEPIESGRFRYFGQLFKKRNSQLMVANLLFLVTLLPLIAVFVIMMVFGVERLSYMLSNTSTTPYFLTSAGIGISSGSSLTDATVWIYKVYQIAFAAAGVSMLFMSIGLSGMMSISMKFVKSDSMVTKKDNYGNDVPRIVKEFFSGIKKHWAEFLIVGAFLMLLVGGIPNIFLFFLTRNVMGAAGAGEWILIILASVFTLFAVGFLIHLIPSIVCYDMTFVQKMKNSLILSIKMFVQTFFMIIVLAAPIIILAVTSGIINILLAAVFLIYGSTFYCLVLSIFGQYYSEKLIIPVYREQFAKPKKKKGKKG